MRCRNCLLPDNVPGADLDATGLCAFCRNWVPADEGQKRATRQARQADLERAVADARAAGARYDALVCLSGGKDSLYLLHRAKVDLGLNVLAFTTDVNIPKVAWSNIRRTIARLGVDHLVYRPSAVVIGWAPCSR